jgi:hypothetical protein
MKGRHGTSLVELLVVMSACTVILTTTGVMINRAMRAESQSRAFYDSERTAWRLSGELRRDLHRARIVAPTADRPDESIFVRLMMDGDQTVEYRRSGSDVFRTLLRGNEVLSREKFAFPLAVDVEVRKLASPRRLSITIAADPPAAASASNNQILNDLRQRVNLQTEGTLSRDLRYAPADRDVKEQP